MTMSSSDAQPSRFPRQQSIHSPTHSTPAMPQSSFPSDASFGPSATPPSFPPSAAMPSPLSFVAPANAMAAEQQNLHAADPVHEHAFDFATHSWDLATGGFKTLTAKREYPLRSSRRPSSTPDEDATTTRNYIFALIVVICVLLMLVGGGIVLFVMLQP